MTAKPLNHSDIHSKVFGLALIIAAACTLLGCSGASDRPATYPVRGTVTYRNLPVAGASLSFLAPGAPRPAAGMTDDEGKFSLSTFTPNDGAIAGTHVVTVTKLAAPKETIVAEPTSDPASQRESIDDAMQQSAQAAEQARSKRSEIPTKYADHTTSDLRITIEPRDNNVTIELSE